MFNIRQIDLDRLNSLTKYPSILTYHALGERGVLQDAIQVPFAGPVLVTEKVDGTNARMIFCPDGSTIVGSREDLLWEKGDLIGNPSMGMVAALRDAVIRISNARGKGEAVVVYFGEVYGANIGSGAKQYSKQGKVGFRLFDMVTIPNWEELLARPAAELAKWRDHGGQVFADFDAVRQGAQQHGLETVPIVRAMDAAEMPQTLPAAQEFTRAFGKSVCALDETGQGAAEGVVVRTHDRRTIAKLRNEDYDRTLRRRN